MSTGTPAIVPLVTRKYFSAIDVGVGRPRAAAAPTSAPAAPAPRRSSEMSSMPTSQAGGVLPEPAQARIGRGPAERLLRQPRHRPVVDDLAVLVAPRRVEDLADAPSSTTSRVIRRSTRRAASGPVIRYLKSGETSISAAALRIALYSCSWCALVGADGVVARPVAVVEALAERERALVERRCRSAWRDYHNARAATARQRDSAACDCSRNSMTTTT